MAPFDGRPQRPVPGLGVAWPGEQVQPGSDPVEQLLGGEHAQPRGRQLQRQRQPIKPCAQPIQDLRPFHRDARSAGAFAQQPRRIVGGQRRYRYDTLG